MKKRFNNYQIRSGILMLGAALALVSQADAQLSATLTDIGSAAPTPGANDIAQLTAPGTPNFPDGLNYYIDNNPPPGQTFTTGTNANGYVLNTVSIRMAGDSGGMPGGGQTFTLRLYSVSGSAATLLGTYVSQSGFTYTSVHWLQWTGLGFGLQPNTKYAYTFVRNSAGYENLANITGNLYAGGEVALIPAAGGGITFGSSHNYDATFDVGLNIANSITLNPISIAPQGSVLAGTPVTFSTTPAVGPGPLFYQWRTDGGSGGTFADIPSATNTSLAVNTSSLAGLYRYALVVTNSSGAITSAPVTLTVYRVAGATLTDVGATVTPGVNDISQLTAGGTGDGLNYYTDNTTPPGQTFTTGTNSQGYFLNSVSIKSGGGTSSGTGTAQRYDLYVYAVSNNTATLVANFTNTSFSFTYGDWLTWSGFSPLVLRSNTTYAYSFRRATTGWAGMSSSPTSSDLYTGGKLCLVPTAGGTITFGTSGLADAVFDIGLTAISPSPTATPIAVSPASNVVSGTTVTLTESALGVSPLSYQWRTDGGSGGSLTNIPGEISASLVFNTTGIKSNAFRYDVIITNSLGSTTSAVSTVTVLVSGGLSFDGVNDYVTFGAAPSLGVTNFTLECWVKRQGAGVTAFTGTDGINAIPLVTKGLHESDAPANLNCNYFLGINTNGALTADFEDRNNGLNHPIYGVTPLVSNVWQHAAVTYDQASGIWVLYLNGKPDVTNVISGTANVRMPEAASIQHATLGSALNSSGTSEGALNGVLDEVRIWNYARTATQISNYFNVQISTPVPGLIARWSLDEPVGTVVSNTISGGVNGTLLNGPLWAAGYPFPTDPPSAPSANSPTNNQIGVTNSPTLSVNASDPDGNILTVTFYGRVASTSSVPDFTLVALPDTQYYSASLYGGSPDIFTNQTQWIINNRTNRNIAYVTQLGDCVEHGDNGGNNVEWRNATNALYRLEDPVTTQYSPYGIPYGVAVGNHDNSTDSSGSGTTVFYNQFFGESHFLPYNYYGGHFGTNNDNHYDLFSAGGMDFIAIYFEYDTTATNANADVYTWANNVLATNANRRALVVSHWILNDGGSYGPQGQTIYNALKGNTNLFLMLCGHINTGTGEASRSDSFDGHTVWSVLSDYQQRAPNGGNGLLRLYEFSPTNNVIRVKTYSPWLDQFETDADSQFEIPYPMTTNAFEAIDSVADIASGGSASVTWWGLRTNTTYEWFATVSDGLSTTTGPIWRFTTGTNAGPIPPSVTLTNPANGASYVAPVNITLGAKASDLDGSVTNVAFYAGATLVGNDTSSPYSFTWSNVAFGNYSLTAVATDDSGLSRTSAPVNITVVAPMAVTRGPYLQSGSHTSVTIRWRTPSGTDSRVLYGTNVANLALAVSDAASTTEHELRLTGLSADTTYFYSVGTTATPLVGGDTNFFYTTAPAPGTKKATRVWVLGDAGTKNANQMAVRNAYYSFAGDRRTDLWLMLGDNAYETGTDSDFQAAVFDMYPTLLRNSVLWPALGNHETGQATDPNANYPYFDMFTLPKSGEAGGLASGTEHYYSFNYANVHFICLDSMTVSRSTSGAMAMWLTNDLVDATADWVIAFWHHPPYTKGSHNSDDAGDSAGSMVEMRQNFLPILEANGVDLVLSGHSHSYERSYLLDGHYGSSGTLTPAMKLDAGNGRTNGTGAYVKLAGGNKIAHKGAVYVVAGSSGQASGGSLNHPAMYVSLNNLGSVVLDINSNRLDAKFIRETGAADDYFTIIKSNAPPIAGNLTFTLNADAATNLTLTASDPNGDALTFTTNSLPARGLISNFNPASGAFTYTPAHAFTGADSFTFSASDGQINSAAASAGLTVTPLADSNTNGIPDVWESLYGVSNANADNDGDGASNLQEYLANTNPTNAASAIRITSTVVNGNGHTIIAWQSTGGTRYRASYSDGDLTAPFTDIVRSVSEEMDTAAPGSTSTQSFTDNLPAPPGGIRFFRIKVVQ